jgi:hypothetical protein
LSRESFRREIEDAFQRISGSPSPDLSSKVRSRLVEAPERRGPMWVAGVAAAVIAVLVLGAFFVAGPLSRLQQHNTVPITAHSPSPSPVQSPSSSYNCSGENALSSAPAPVKAYINDIRTGQHPGYDRITFQFSNGAPASMQVKWQANANFVAGASGQPVTLQGSTGLLVVINNSDAHTSYAGPTDIKTGYKGLLEARQLEDFEGTVQWGLGLAGKGCFFPSLLTNPDRLVIDIKTS